MPHELEEEETEDTEQNNQPEDIPDEVPPLDLPPAGRCMKCRKNVTIQNPQVVDLNNPKKAVKGLKGTCPDCGKTVFKILKAG